MKFYVIPNLSAFVETLGKSPRTPKYQAAKKAWKSWKYANKMAADPRIAAVSSRARGHFVNDMYRQRDVLSKFTGKRLNMQLHSPEADARGTENFWAGIARKAHFGLRKGYAGKHIEWRYALKQARNARKDKNIPPLP